MLNDLRPHSVALCAVSYALYIRYALYVVVRLMGKVLLMLAFAVVPIGIAWVLCAMWCA